MQRAIGWFINIYYGKRDIFTSINVNEPTLIKASCTLIPMNVSRYGRHKMFEVITIPVFFSHSSNKLFQHTL